MFRKYAFKSALPLPKRVLRDPTDVAVPRNDDCSDKRTIMPSPAAIGIRQHLGHIHLVLEFIGVVFAFLSYSSDQYIYAMAWLGLAGVGGVFHWISRRYNLGRPDRFITFCREDGFVYYETGLFRKRTHKFRFSEVEGYLQAGFNPVGMTGVATRTIRLYAVHPTLGRFILEQNLPLENLLSKWSFFVQYMDPDAPLPAAEGLIPYKKNEPPKPPYPRFSYYAWKKQWEAAPPLVYREAVHKGVDAVLEPGTLDWRWELAPLGGEARAAR